MLRDDRALTFGLPPCLHVPIAAANLAAIEQFVGHVEAVRTGIVGRINAVLVAPRAPAGGVRSPIKLWRHLQAEEFWQILHGRKQVWVHVDFAGYRRAYVSFGLPALAADEVLDHIQNRRAVRLRGNQHPLLRLCPIPKAINTNAGGRSGQEGLERAHVAALGDLSEEWQAEIQRLLTIPIQYADPADLTKMLGFVPGTQTLDGVRDAQSLFYETI